MRHQSKIGLWFKEMWSLLLSVVKNSVVFLHFLKIGLGGLKEADIHVASFLASWVAQTPPLRWVSLTTDPVRLTIIPLLNHAEKLPLTLLSTVPCSPNWPKCSWCLLITPLPIVTDGSMAGWIGLWVTGKAGNGLYSLECHPLSLTLAVLEPLRIKVSESRSVNPS